MAPLRNEDRPIIRQIYSRIDNEIGRNLIDSGVERCPAGRKKIALWRMSSAKWRTRHCEVLSREQEYRRRPGNQH